MTGMAIILAVLQLILRGQLLARIVWFGAGAGTTLPSIAGLRIGTATIRRIGTYYIGFRLSLARAE